MATADPRDTALGLLGRREHSVLELRHKLTRRGFESEAVDTVLSELQNHGWLDESRFAEVYAAQRADKGYGPLRIRRELRERGLTDTIIDPVLDQLADVWPVRLKHLNRKRFGSRPPADVAERARRLRFFRHRGFTAEQIDHLYRRTD